MEGTSGSLFINVIGKNVKKCLKCDDIIAV